MVDSPNPYSAGAGEDRHVQPGAYDPQLDSAMLKAIGLGLAAGLLLLGFALLAFRIRPYLGLVGGLCAANFIAMMLFNLRAAKKQGVRLRNLHVALAIIAFILILLGITLALILPIQVAPVG